MVDGGAGVVAVEGGGGAGAAGAGRERVVKPRPLGVLPDSAGLTSWFVAFDNLADDVVGSEVEAGEEVEANAAACDVRDRRSACSSLWSL